MSQTQETAHVAVTMYTPMGDQVDVYLALDRVVAEVERLRATVADAWDEGYDAGHAAARAVNPEWPEQPVNPHRAALEGDR